MKKLLCAVLALYVLEGVFAQTSADRDAARRDVYVMLDVSGSMNTEEKFPHVIDYIEREVLDGLLKTGDTFTLISFGDTSGERFSRTLSGEDDRLALREELGNLRADDNYTDIGTALETLADILEKRNVPDVRRVILFITDGKNTPPPSSPYYGKDLSVDEHFRSVGEKISRGGWFLYVIGIGGDTDVRDIAGAVDGSVYTNTDSNLSGLEINSYIESVDEKVRDWEDAQKAGEGGTGTGDGGGLSAAGIVTGIAILDNAIGRFAALLGLSPRAAACIALAALLVLLLLILLLITVRPVEIIVSDSRETIKRKLSPFGSLTLNAPGTVLPAIKEGKAVVRIERSLKRLRIKALDGGELAPESPLLKAGALRLEKSITVQLKNKKSVIIKKG
ncbi:MAG: VWA domain-containing protein [Spirochaetaceae bacterium]|jgi:Mg-chelatase subunit ChlD|nr:VWA domain-containing protein [Spirochaetaceae bacterium]